MPFEHGCVVAFRHFQNVAYTKAYVRNNSRIITRSRCRRLDLRPGYEAHRQQHQAVAHCGRFGRFHRLFGDLERLCYGKLAI